MAHVNVKHGKKIKNQKIKIKIKCVGDPIFSICLISNTLPQLEPSSFIYQQYSIIATCYSPPDIPHLQRRKPKQQQARNPGG